MLLKKIERTPKMIDVCFGYHPANLDEHHLVAKVPKAGLDRQLDSRELPSIVAQALLSR